MATAAKENVLPVWRHMRASPLPTGNERRPVVIVGGGPVGLTLALDLGRRGHEVLVLNRLTFVTAGSKAICFAKRSLEIWDRLGVGETMLAKGVAWNVGKVFRGHGTQPIYSFDVEPVKNQRMPGFINLQQYHVEDILIDALDTLPNVDLRWGHEAVAIHPKADGVILDVRTDEGTYKVNADWVVACDGSRSPLRDMIKIDFPGRAFEDNFLIADIRMREHRPAERWFWFDPPFNPGRSALLHKQPDDMWRLDFQLGPDTDRAACTRPETAIPLIEGLLGKDCAFEIQWLSVYTFHCRRMDSFIHGRVLFAGDSAHVVSPFGARGCNGGIADAHNLGWKLDLVMRRVSDPSLLESYDYEAGVTADENILNSCRATDFMAPASDTAGAFRDAVLDLAGRYDFARSFVNSGRLSTAVAYPHSPLSTPDVQDEAWTGVPPGSAAIDAPTDQGWLLETLGKGEFVLLTHRCTIPSIPHVYEVALESIGDPQGLVAERYDLTPGSAYLFRPDQYVAARWRTPSLPLVKAAVAQARGGTG